MGCGSIMILINRSLDNTDSIIGRRKIIRLNRSELKSQEEIDEVRGFR